MDSSPRQGACHQRGDNWGALIVVESISRVEAAVPRFLSLLGEFRDSVVVGIRSIGEASQPGPVLAGGGGACPADR